MTDAECWNISDIVYHLTHTGALLCMCNKIKKKKLFFFPNVNVTYETYSLFVDTAKYIQ